MYDQYIVKYEILLNPYRTCILCTWQSTREYFNHLCIIRSAKHALSLNWHNLKKTGKGSSIICLHKGEGVDLPHSIPICSSPIWCQQLPGSVSGSGRHWAVPASPGLGGRCRTPAIHKHKHGILTVIQPFDDSQYTARHVDSWHHIHMQNSYNRLCTCIGKCITQPLPMGLLLASSTTACFA